SWFENDGSQNFTTHVIGTGIPGINSLSIADFDNDGDLDIVTSNVSTSVYIRLFTNDGNENFTGTLILRNEIFVQDSKTVSIADIDNDRDIDIISHASLGRLAINFNDGNGGFVAPLFTTTSLTDLFGLFTADIDGDGDLDIVSSSKDENTLAWYENNGAGNFTSSEHIVATDATSIRNVSAADIDGDGDMDLMSASASDNTIAWYENDGSQNFTKITIDTSAMNAQDVSASDVDGDGDIDIIAASKDDDSVVLYVNDGSDVFTKKVITNVADGAKFVRVVDIDSDGDLDIIGSSDLDDLLDWYENKTTLKVSPTVFLQGPYDAGAGTMKDDLRVAGIISTTSPYADGLITNSSVFATTGNDAIVDWVYVELRDKTDITSVLAASSAFVQRDGDVVASDGVSPIDFVIDSDDYYVSISHRNHISIATDAAVSLTTTAQLVNFTNNINVIRGTTNAVKEVKAGIYGMFAGNTDGSGQVQTTTFSNTIGFVGQSGYSIRDANMDGQIQTIDLTLIISLIGNGIQF
ncbi:MAG: VCBS repeat-containing protein, partial [Flavobacteriaceae bacterium]|nr:VCBS repeat-containing protein [Flavobacteriaceae bacterium]